MSENAEVPVDVDGAIDLGEKVKAQVATDPDAVRKIITGAVAVEDYVTVYPNKEVNLRFQKHVAEVADAAAQARAAEEVTPEMKANLERLEAEAKALREEVAASGITFKFVSLGKKAVKRIRAEVQKQYPFPPAGEQDDPALASDRQDAYEEWLIAAHLVDSGYTREDVAEWRDKFPLQEFGKLWAMAQRLSIADDYLQGAFNVDF